MDNENKNLNEKHGIALSDDDLEMVNGGSNILGIDLEKEKENLKVSAAIVGIMTKDKLEEYKQKLMETRDNASKKR